jgi:hypothetical protein
MTKFLVLLGLSVTVVLSSPLPSESQEDFFFVPWWGLNETTRPVFEPGSLVLVEMSQFQFNFCFSGMPGGEDCQPGGGGGVGLPAGTQLISSREAVASVESDGERTVIRLNRPGNTILRLRETAEKKRILATYRLIVSPVDAGTACSSVFLGASSFITDCAGRCVRPEPLDPSEETSCPPGLPCVAISERISDGMCNFGRRLADGSRDIHLACRTFTFDGGDCPTASLQ